MVKRRLVLIGNGMAGIHCLEEILKLAPGAFDITVVGSEPHPNYNRILLSSVLSGDADIRDIILNDWNWYRQKGVKLYAGQTATRIDTAEKILVTDQGLRLAYDELILATGSLPVMLPVPGIEKEGVAVFRDLKDCEMMIAASRRFRKAVVIGGGLLGLEAARGLLNLNLQVTVVHLFDILMERQLDATASRMLRGVLEQGGMEFRLSKKTVGLTGGDRVTGVRFSDGSVEPADLVVMAAGIRPNAALAAASGIATGRGVLVDDYLETSAPNVYAVGECVEHRGVTYGLVAPLYEQGKILARRLCGFPVEPYAGSIVRTRLKVSGVDVFSAGELLETPETRAIRVHDEIVGVYKKVLLRRNHRIAGAILFGDTRDSTRLVQMIGEGTELSDLRRLAFLSESGGNRPASLISDVSAMSDGEIICGCMGVSKGAIVEAIREKGLTSVAQVSACTGASRSCGGCKPLVAQLLQLELGDAFKAAPASESICPCTPLSRDQVVAAIRAQRLTSTFEVMSALDWGSPEGCSKCRPALNYYLNLIRPGERADEPESRLVNERLMANIQNDGSYSVVPRIYGGVTTPEQLRRIADAAETYNAGMIKLTGGQRISLLGLHKEDLPAVWAELGLPSGSAYAKAVRTVKTCAGSLFCRFGTQDSVRMGIEIEKKFENLDTPAKVKMAASGCPRNCAETWVKDFGAIGVDGGWEIYVGGNGGMHMRKTDLLCKVKTADEVLEICAAFLQHYREEARYGERTSTWIERVGIEPVRGAVLDPENQTRLRERMDRALAARVRDPWREAVRTREARRRYAKLNPGTDSRRRLS